MSGSVKSNVPSIQPRIIRPGRPTLQTVYQLAVQASPAQGTISDAFTRAILTTLDWVASKYPDKLPKDLAYSNKSFKCEVPGQRVTCAVHAGMWAIRLEQPDTAFNDRPAVGGRNWTTDIAFNLRDEKLHMGVKAVCASLPECTANIFLTRPAVIKRIAAAVGLSDGLAIRPAPYLSGKDISVDDLYGFITNPARRLPVIVLSQPDEHKPHPSDIRPFVLDEIALANDMAGYAHVVLLPFAQAFEWTARVGKPWTVFNGAVRTYMPSLNFEGDPLYVHPLTILDKIQFWSDPVTKQIAEPAFTSFLTDSIKISNINRRIDWSNILFVNDVELKAQQAQQSRLADLLASAHTDKDAVAVLKDQLAAKGREIELLEKTLMEKTGEYEESLSLAEQAELDKTYYAEENSKLRSSLNILRAQLEHKNKQKIDETIPLPDSLDELQSWFDNFLVGRVVLHPRAVRSIGKSEYESPMLIYQSLMLLANEYRQMRLGEIDQDTYFAARDKLQLRDGGSIEESGAGKFGDTYFVNYPVGSCKKRFLDSHLRCKSSTRDPRRCLAIYYFWDSDSQQVVVGSLPAHLENRMT